MISQQGGESPKISNLDIDKYVIYRERAAGVGVSQLQCALPSILLQLRMLES